MKISLLIKILVQKINLGALCDFFAAFAVIITEIKCLFYNHFISETELFAKNRLFFVRETEYG